MATSSETYFLVATVTANSEADAIDAFLNADPPIEAPTIYELRQRINDVLFDFAGSDDERPMVVARLIEIVTLGNVSEKADR